jgi:hypothetical protein
VIDVSFSMDKTPRNGVWRQGRNGEVSMNWVRSAIVLGGLVVAIMFSGVGLYSVNADGRVEQVVDGYAVVAPVR